MSKVIFVHPAIRPYREELFDLLDSHYNIKFLFTEDYDHNQKILKDKELKNWQAYKTKGLLLYSKGVAWPLLREALSGDYDVWISSVLNSFATHVTFPLVKLRGKRFILFAEDWWWQKNWKSWLARPYARFIARKSDAILAASSRTRKFFIDLGADPKRVFLAINASTNYGVKRLAKSDGSKFTVLYLSRVVKYKGLDILIRAFSRLERGFANVELVVVGGGDEFREECQRLAQGLGVKNINWVGQVPTDEVGRYYQQADCMVLPARFLWESNVPAEAWGFAVNEGLSMGLPLIVTDAVAAGEDLIVDGVNGFNVRLEDDSDLYSKLRWLAVNRAARLLMGEAAQRRMAEFSPKKQFASFKTAISDRNSFEEIKDEVAQIHGWLTDNEGRCLHDLAKTFPRSKAIVEIGSWQGKSTVCLAKGSLLGGQSKVYAIDPHTGAPEQRELYGENIKTFQQFKDNIKAAGIDTMVTPLVKFSDEVAREWSGGEVGLIFIDGSHQYEDVKKDFLLWEPLVAEGGVMTFHDSYAPGPSQVLERYVYASKNFRVIEVVDNLTVVVKVKSLPLRVYIKQRLIGWKKGVWRQIKKVFKGSRA